MEEAILARSARGRGSSRRAKGRLQRHFLGERIDVDPTGGEGGHGGPELARPADVPLRLGGIGPERDDHQVVGRLALGEGDRVPGWIAAWTPNIVFAGIGLYLLYLRASNRESPSFNPFAARRIVAR